MRVRITLDINVGDNPTADAITYFIYQYGHADADDAHTPDEWAEEVIRDVVEGATADIGVATTWELTATHVDVIS